MFPTRRKSEDFLWSMDRKCSGDMFKLCGGPEGSNLHLGLDLQASRAANPIAVRSLWRWCHSHEAVFPMTVLEI